MRTHLLLLMSTQFVQVISRLQTAPGPSERKHILLALAGHVLTCHQLGMVLMNLKYSAERVSAASMLALHVVDPENATSHLLPYLSWEEHSTREEILRAFAGR